MITFERALSEWLKKETNASIGAYLKNNTVQVNLQSAADLNRWQIMGTFAVVANYSDKLSASLAFETMRKAMTDLRNKQGINTVYMLDCNAVPTETTGEWQYQGLFQIRYRVRDSWSIQG